MRYLKIYENYQTKEEVAYLCEIYGIYNWSISQDGIVDVDGYVDLRFKELKKLPLKFGIVSGNFFCSRNELTTLEGAPESVDGNFYCNFNKLTTLKGGPKSVGDCFYCYNNELTTLEGAPGSVGSDFDCVHNKLITLEGAPGSVSGSFDCSYNKLTTLQGAPYSVGYFNYSFNTLPDLIKKNFTHIKHILANQEIYHIYNKDGTINKYRFQLMMDSMD